MSKGRSGGRRCGRRVEHEFVALAVRPDGDHLALASRDFLAAVERHGLALRVLAAHDDTAEAAAGLPVLHFHRRSLLCWLMKRPGGHAEHEPARQGAAASPETIPGREASAGRRPGPK